MRIISYKGALYLRPYINTQIYSPAYFYKLYTVPYGIVETEIPYGVI